MAFLNWERASGVSKRVGNLSWKQRFLSSARNTPLGPMFSWGGDSLSGTDGDDGDGQGSRFWAVQHSPKGEAPFSAPQAEKKLGPK